MGLYFKVTLMLMIKHSYSDFTKPLQGNIQLIAVGHNKSILFICFLLLEKNSYGIAIA